MVTGGTHGAAGVGEKRKSSRSELQYDINEDGAIQRENSNKTRWTTAYDRLRRAKDRDQETGNNDEKKQVENYCEKRSSSSLGGKACSCTGKGGWLGRRGGGTAWGFQFAGMNNDGTWPWR